MLNIPSNRNSIPSTTALFLTLLRLTPSCSQTISTNMPLPPMEWIKLDPSGSTSPPPLSHGCLSGPTYTDLTSPSPSQAYLFGGRSAAGTSSNGIYLLDYSSQSPVWSQPPTTPSTLFTSSPQPRSHLLCGWDRASNFRNQLNIYGGRSEDGQPLNDFWFYDPVNNFWAQPKDVSPANHPANYGGIGGMDPTYQPSPPGTSNAIVYVGGASSAHSNDNLVPSALSIDGQLGSNTNTVQANYSSLAPGLTGNASAYNFSNGRWGMTGTVMPDLKIVVFSGCNGDPSNEFKDTLDPSCSLLNGGILQFESGFSASKLETMTTPPTSSWTQFSYCPAPRVGGTMVPNRNRFDSSFAHQAIMIGGRIDSKSWNDQGGSHLGEVDVLDISSGVWSRVLPMRRDNATFTQKEGLLALALPSVIGSKGVPAANGPTDILIYGGIDVSTGQASSELWILRLHAAKLTGNGTADGVTMSYLPSCVSPTPQNTHNVTKINDPTAGPSDGPSEGSLEAPPGHLIFSSLALAMLMLALTILRCEEPGQRFMKKGWRDPRLWLVAGGWNILVISYAFLVLGIVIALFQSRDTLVLPLTRRSLFAGDSTHRKLSIQTTLSRSAHAKLGLVVGFAALVLVPALYLLSWFDASLEDRRQKQLASGGPRKLKAKGSQGSGLRQRTLERMVLLSQSFNRPKPEKHQSSMSGSINHHRLESLREKHSDILIEQELSAPSSRETSPRLPPIAVEVNSHERLGSTSTAGTNSQLLATVGGFGIEGGQFFSNTASLTQRPSQPQLKPLTSSPPERPLIRPLSSPFSKIFQNFSGSNKNSTPTKPPPSAPENDEGRARNNLASSVSTGSAFEVLNRKPPSRQQRGGVNGNRPARVSLDILSDSGSSRSVPSQVLRPNSGVGYTTEEYGGERKEGNYSQVSRQEHTERGDEEQEEEEDDDDDDSEYNKTIKARRKMRRLADMMLHSILLVTNIYLISTCFVSSRDLKWLGIVYTCLCLSCYSIMIWFAWIGKPSSESTLVIFISIIKDGSRSLMKNENLTGLGQFSSFRQQQQQAQQILAQGGRMVGGGGASSIGGGGGMGENRSTTTGRRFQGLSVYSASQNSALGGGSLINSPEFSFRAGGGMLRSASPTETDFFGPGGGGSLMSSAGGPSGLLGYNSSSNHNHNQFPPQLSHPYHHHRNQQTSNWDASSISHEEEICHLPPDTSGATAAGSDYPPMFDDEIDHATPPNNDPASDTLDHLNHLIVDPNDHDDVRRNDRLSELGESYLAHREVQIVTTAPKRKLTVVNG